MIGFHGDMKRFKPLAIAQSAGRRIARGESGAALVEFALAASFILALFFGVIQFGYALYTFQFVNETAREMTRYAIVRGSACTGLPNCGFTDSGTTLQTYARSTYMYPGMRMNNLTVTSKWYTVVTSSGQYSSLSAPCASGAGCNNPGDIVQVKVTYPFLLSIPFWSATTMTISNTSSMVISQ